MVAGAESLIPLLFDDGGEYSAGPIDDLMFEGATDHEDARALIKYGCHFLANGNGALDVFSYRLPYAGGVELYNVLHHSDSMTIGVDFGLLLHQYLEVFERAIEVGRRSRLGPGTAGRGLGDRVHSNSSGLGL